MSLFELEPVVRKFKRSRQSSLCVPVSGVIRLNEVTSKITADIFEILAVRASIYQSNILTLDNVSVLLWFCFVRRPAPGNLDQFCASRAYPSAGGLNSVHLLIQNIPDAPGIWIYRPESHALAHIDDSEAAAVLLKKKAAACLSVAPATLIWLCADVGAISEKYENYESLVLREAGFILSNLTLVGTALKFFPVALGVLGGSAITKMLPWTSTVVGVGALHISA